MRQLPTRAEWEGWQERRLRPTNEAGRRHPPAVEDFDRPPTRRPTGARARADHTQPTNVLAVVSLAFGILWLYWLGSLIAVVTGHIARRQIRDSHDVAGGDALAVVGLAFGWVGLGVLLVILLAATGS